MHTYVICTGILQALFFTIASALRPKYNSNSMKILPFSRRISKIVREEVQQQALTGIEGLTSLAMIGTNVELVEGFSQAFVGGTVGVMGMAFIVEMRKMQDESLEGCPYCMGNGEILCGECLGQGMSLQCAPNTAKLTNDGKCQCSSCRGRGLVICINCKGDGRNMPIILQSKAIRDPDYAIKDRLNEFDLDSP